MRSTPTRPDERARDPRRDPLGEEGPGPRDAERLARERSVVLSLGPTNTGKTHGAIEQMLQHQNGMIGLPLRLLAREVYDRITRRIGERDVALITGEEKRIPPSPRYWVATVEAMPTDVSVDFLAVDEIQLAAHRERGHVFTDRLLSARGRRETVFLGAETMMPLARTVLPEASLRRQTRLSTLRHTGRSGLGGLPARSAVVAFSADEVYAIAARLKARRGGAAVVLGALSPRTRNAQVALYQAGEVKYLVATDAIGMGLNLDVDHVAFAAVDKFDGRDRRRLRDDELAQIAGRAGRNQRDGTFGTLNPLEKLDERTVRNIEEHRFAPVRRLVYRNTQLDYGSVDALIASLAAPPPADYLTRVEQADDFDALRTLAARPEIREAATDAATVALLFEVCQVPDYRKLMLLRHAALLGEIFLGLVSRGRIDPAFIAGHVDRIDRVDGDLDTLTARLSAIRVWTYISHRGDWVEDATAWQARTRAIEDRIGDALHERLVERFVERTKRSVTISRDVALRIDEGNPFAALRGMLEEERETARSDADALVEAAVDAAHAAFEVDDAGNITLDGDRLGRLTGGRALDAPTAVVSLSPDKAAGLSPGARHRLERRLGAFARDYVSALLAPLRVEVAEPAERGLFYQLAQHLGTIDRRAARAQIDALGREGRARMEALGVRFGRRALFVPAMSTGPSRAARQLLVRLYYGEGKRPPEAWLAAGEVELGGCRLDVAVLEDVLDRLHRERPPFALPATVSALLNHGLSDTTGASTELPALDSRAGTRLLAALGYRRRDDGLLEPKRRRRRRR